jgi:hypothetical protein
VVGGPNPVTDTATLYMAGDGSSFFKLATSNGGHLNLFSVQPNNAIATFNSDGTTDFSGNVTIGSTSAVGPSSLTLETNSSSYSVTNSDDFLSIGPSLLVNPVTSNIVIFNGSTFVNTALSIVDVPTGGSPGSVLTLDTAGTTGSITMSGTATSLTLGANSATLPNNIVMTPQSTSIGNRNASTNIPLLTIYNDSAIGTGDNSAIYLQSNLNIAASGPAQLAFDINGYDLYTSAATSCGTGITSITNPYGIIPGIYAIMCNTGPACDGFSTMARFSGGSWVAGGGGLGFATGAGGAIGISLNGAAAGTININNTSSATLAIVLTYVRLTGNSFHLPVAPPS